MGWKKLMRSMNSAQKQAEQSQARKTRAEERRRVKVGKSVDLAMRKASKLETSANRDVIKTFSISYDRDNGFRSKPVILKTEMFSLSLELIRKGNSSPDGSSHPPFFQNDLIKLEPLDLLVSQWATIIALEISNFTDETLTLRLIKKTNPAESSLFLIDVENGKYYYPISTDLKGDVVNGFPRTGIITFQPFEKPTRAFQLRVSSLRIGKKKAPVNCVFEFNDENLFSEITDILSKPTIPQYVKQLLEEL